MQEHVSELRPLLSALPNLRNDELFTLYAKKALQFQMGNSISLTASPLTFTSSTATSVPSTRSLSTVPNTGITLTTKRRVPSRYHPKSSPRARQTIPTAFTRSNYQEERSVSRSAVATSLANTKNNTHREESVETVTCSTSTSTSTSNSAMLTTKIDANEEKQYQVLSGTGSSRPFHCLKLFIYV